MAVLPESNAIVFVGPPLSFRVSSFGSITFVWSPVVGVMLVQDMLPIRLYPCEVNVPLKSGQPVAVFRAMMVFLALTVPPKLPLSLIMPPPLLAELREMVLLVRFTIAPGLYMPPPPDELLLLAATLPEMVLLVTFTVPR
ncbi:MAG: hypothetical protein DLM73_01780 [Chthoniobacterales bacterium]|nr:MAG: hypothetical protein DLM73_01780 [Chthoniobacterales bacterium]